MNRTALPKNVRQIGKSDDLKRIYIEDYVTTYIKQSAMSKSKGNFILLGETGNVGGTQATFINGAVNLKEEGILINEIISKEAWDDVYYQLQNYFEGYSIIGWCCISQDSANDDNYGFMLQKFGNIQRKNFPGNDKVFIHYNSVMMEENVYYAKDNSLKVPRGYYVYYERNDKMQEYMMCENERTGTDHEYSDDITAKIRDTINEKDSMKNKINLKMRHGIISKGEDKKKKWAQNLYTAAAAVAVVCLLAVAAGKSGVDFGHAINTINEKLHSGDGGAEAKEDKASDGKEEETGSIITQQVQGKIPKAENDNLQDEKEDGENDEIKNTDKNTDKNSDDDDDKDTLKEENDKDGKKNKDAKNNKDDEKVDEKNTQETMKEGRTYKIKEGDTLARISKDNYGTVLKVKEICELNGIENENMIHQGDVINLPD